MKTKSKHIDISIENPCGQSFQDFHRTSNGGFCKSCRKEVIDFTHLSEGELFHFFEAETDRVCGQFRPGQLRTLIYRRPTGLLKFSMLPAFVAVLAAFSSADAHSSDIEIEKRSVLSTRKFDERSFPSPRVEAALVTIAGRVVDENEGVGIPGANVLVKGTKHETYTDLDGNFKLTISQSIESVVLVVSFVGYQEQELAVSLMQPHIDLGSIEISLEVMVLGEVCVRRWTPKGIWYRLRHSLTR